MTERDPLIAGTRRASDWRELRKQLLNAPSRAMWEQAYEEYLVARLDTRYFDPVRRLKGENEWAGEGFSIMVILCSLVEFLESTVRGLRYRNGGPLAEYEYGSSRDMFVEFLVSREPFSAAFRDKDIALEFYQAVRCGLMHEAQTKRGWIIWATSHRNAIIDQRERIVFRDDFQEALQEFLKAYRDGLLTNPELQAAFIRKFDSLCE